MNTLSSVQLGYWYVFRNAESHKLKADSQDFLQLLFMQSLGAQKILCGAPRANLLTINSRHQHLKSNSQEIQTLCISIFNLKKEIKSLNIFLSKHLSRQWRLKEPPSDSDNP